MPKNFNIYISFMMILFLITACAPTPTKSTQSRNSPTQRPYKVLGKWYSPLDSAHGYHKVGNASWYGKDFHGKKTSNGEVYNMYALSAAHKTLPLDTYVRVTRLDNSRSIVVRINDRGPFVKGRIIDLSYNAAKKLGLVEEGVTRVQVEALGKKTRGSYVQADYSKGTFMVQVGAFTVKENALKLKQSLKKRYGAADIAVYNNGGEVFYRVRVGKYTTITKAEKARNTFMETGFNSPFVVAEE